MSSTMYDVIMELPLLQGISREYVSAFLEKTYVEFINSAEGSKLMQAGETENFLLYIISGKVESKWENRTGEIAITFTLGEKSLIDAAHLFGMSRIMPYTLQALTNVSLLRIEKSQFLAFLDKQPIYLLNFINYLSLRAQKGIESLACQRDASLRSLMATWINAVTPTEAEDIMVHASTYILSRYSNLSAEAVRRALAAMQSEGLINRKRDIISITSRRQFLQELFS